MNCLVLLSLLFSAPPSAAPPVREPIEWANIWITGGDRSDRPKVLLIGDSIVMGYSARVADALKDRADCCRLSTSKSLGDPAYLDEVRLVASQYPFAVIHFNNGLHGWGYTEQQYREAFPKLLALLRQCAPQAKLIWVTTTPVRKSKQVDQVDPRTDRVRARNQIAAALVQTAGIATDDLFRAVEKRPEYYSQDGVHFNPKGVAALAEQVTKHVEKALP